MRHAYDSDISREQFIAISQELETTKKKTRPRKVHLYDIFCAILYLLKNACTWRNLPHDFPNWKLVNYYYRTWTKKNENGESVLDCILSKLVDIERYTTGRNVDVLGLPYAIFVTTANVSDRDGAVEMFSCAGFDKLP